MSTAESATFYEAHGKAIRQAVAARRGPAEEPLVVAMHEHLQLDPVSGETRPVPSRSAEMLRLYFQFLRDNERLPRGSQVPRPEIRLVWETLLAFFGEDDLDQDKIGQVFRLIQRKMEQGAIGQAWILLNIFDYQRSVRLDNERSLFLEEMALVFSRRQDDGGRTITPELRELLRQAAGDLTLLPRAVERLATELEIRLDLLREDVEEQAAWAGIWGAALPEAAAPEKQPEAPAAATEEKQPEAPAAATEGKQPEVPAAVAAEKPQEAPAADAEKKPSAAPAVDAPEKQPEASSAPAEAPAAPVAASALPALLRNRKWRPVQAFGPDADAQLLADFRSPESVRAYCDALFKGVYFLILITENTGFEDFLVTFVEWLRELIGPEAMRVFSSFHAQVTLEEKTINESLEAMFTTPPLEALPERVAAVTGPMLADAARSLLTEWAEADLLTVAPGEYSLEGLLLDRALALTFPRFDLSWRLHRLL